MILVQLGEGGFQSEITPGDLKFLNQVGGSGEQNPPAIFHQSVADSGRQVRLAAAGRPKEYKIGAFFQPAVTGDPYSSRSRSKIRLAVCFCLAGIR